MRRATERELVMAVIEHDMEEAAKFHPAPKPTKATRPKKEKKRRQAKPNPDYWFSLCVRERANWTCEACGKHYEPWISAVGQAANPGLHTSHFFGRANYAVRFEPLNADAHCYACHAKFEGDPYAFCEWKRERLGATTYDVLVEKAKDLMLGKQARHEKQEIANHFKHEYEMMMQQRAAGETGRIEFIGYL